MLLFLTFSLIHTTLLKLVHFIVPMTITFTIQSHSNISAFFIDRCRTLGSCTPKEKARPFLRMPRLEKSKFYGIIHFIIMLSLSTLRKCLNILSIQFVFPFIPYRLALYVYEYLLHVGAQKAAQTFLSEVSLYQCLSLLSIEYINNPTHSFII